MKHTCRYHVLVAVLVARSGIASAGDEPVDGGVAPDAATVLVPADATVPTESTPTDATPAAPTGDQPAGDEPKKTKKKKKKDDASDDEWDGTPQGDMVGPDDHGGLTTYGVKLRFLFQFRYAKTIPEFTDALHLDPRPINNDGYSLNRIFLRGTSRPLSWLSAKVLIDFADFSHKVPGKALKLAYADIKLHPQVTVTVGYFKRTYSLLELLPIADYEVADVGPTDVLLKDAELAGRDTGAMIKIDPLEKKRWLNIYLGTYSGGLKDSSATPIGLLTGRIVTQPIKHLQLAVNGAWRHKGETPAPGFLATAGAGKAIGFDVIYTRKHYNARAEWLWGDRTDLDHAGDAKTYMAAWAIAAVRLDLGDKLTVMPAARFEYLDADREHPIGRRYLITGAINVMDRDDILRFVLDISRSQVEAGTFPLNQAPGFLDQSSTIIIGQVQVKI